MYNEIDKEITNLFKVARDMGEALTRSVELTPFSREEYLHCYEHSTDPLEKARRTLVKSFFGYGSDSIIRKNGFRGVVETSRSTPAECWRTYPRVLLEIIDRLQGVIIENRKAKKLIDKYDRQGTLFYADPPYLLDTRKDKKRIYRNEFSVEDHIKLADKLNHIDGYAMVSGYESELYDKLYAGWRKDTAKSFDANNQVREEILWISPNIPEQIDLFSEKGTL